MVCSTQQCVLLWSTSFLTFISLCLYKHWNGRLKTGPKTDSSLFNNSEKLSYLVPPDPFLSLSFTYNHRTLFYFDRSKSHKLTKSAFWWKSINFQKRVILFISCQVIFVGSQWSLWYSCGPDNCLLKITIQGGWNYPEIWDPKTFPDNSNAIRIIPTVSG